MSEQTTPAKPVFIRLRVEVSESEYFSYKAKKGDTEITICVMDYQLKDLPLSTLSEGLLPIAVLKYEACEEEEE